MQHFAELAKQATLEQGILVLWHRADLAYKLKPCQKAMLAAIRASQRFKYVIKCARRLGKSYLLCVIAVMVCLSKANAQVRYAAPTQKQLRKLIRPILRKILADCPPELQPTWNGAEGAYQFPNGSELHVAGVNNGRADDLRGPASDLFIIDEAGTVDDLHYLVHDVAMPQLLDQDMQVVAGRRLLLASSPPRTPAHEFTTMAMEAELEGYYSHYTIFDGEYPEDVIRLFLKEDGVPQADIDALLARNFDTIKSTTVRREYLAQDVVDEAFALVPEWRESMQGEVPIDEYFPYYKKYDSLDVGVSHLSVDLLAHYDFQRAKLYVHDEVAMNGPDMTTDQLARSIREKEVVYFGVKWEEYLTEKKEIRYRMVPPSPHFSLKRVSDHNLLLIQDMSRLHGLYFEPCDKGGLEEMINQVRIWVREGRIVVHPRCKQLLGCLKYGVWNKRRTDFDEVPVYGHFDALAALMYLVRNCDTRTNPIPADHGKPPDDWWWKEDPRVGRRDKLRQLFNQRGRIRGGV